MPCHSQVVLLCILRRRRRRHPTRLLRARIPPRTALRSTTPRQQTIVTRRAPLITRRLRMLRRNHTHLVPAMIASATRLLCRIHPWTREVTRTPQATTRLPPATARATRVPLIPHPNRPTLRLHTRPPKRHIRLRRHHILPIHRQNPATATKTNQSPARHHQPCAPRTTPHTITKAVQ